MPRVHRPGRRGLGQAGVWLGRTCQPKRPVAPQVLCEGGPKAAGEEVRRCHVQPQQQQWQQLQPLPRDRQKWCLRLRCLPNTYISARHGGSNGTTSNLCSTTSSNLCYEMYPRGASSPILTLLCPSHARALGRPRRTRYLPCQPLKTVRRQAQRLVTETQVGLS